MPVRQLIPRLKTFKTPDFFSLRRSVFLTKCANANTTKNNHCMSEVFFFSFGRFFYLRMSKIGRLSEDRTVTRSCSYPQRRTPNSKFFDMIFPLLFPLYVNDFLHNSKVFTKFFPPKIFSSKMNAQTMFRRKNFWF